MEYIGKPKRYGGMGMLFTPEEHRRKGYARLCLAALSRRLLSRGVTPFVYVETDNPTSQRLFSRMGFKRKHRANWIGYAPKGKKSGGGGGCGTKKGCCY